MGIDSFDASRLRAGTPLLSGRARSALQQHQRRVTELQRDVQSADRVLSGALTACDGHSQREMLSAYLESVQELRVSLQRLESFLLQRLVGVSDEGEPAGGAMPSAPRATHAD